MTILTPYPGLRPFHRDEAHIFFGREEQTDQLLRRLNETRFLAVLGPSGCGKSSLVRAGMIAALESGFMASAGSRWRFSVMRPGNHPMTGLSTALINDAGLSMEGANKNDAIGFLGAMLRKGPLGLVEALKETPLAPSTNLLILVDQFEEIFRFRKEGDRDEAEAFVSLLLETTRQREIPIYVVLTMRSDFLGDCALFGGLPEAMNQSQYLTPRLSREQRSETIFGPARVFGGDVEPELINRLLNELGSDPDRLPVLQHLLMRMWTRKQEEPVEDLEEPIARILTTEDYFEVGGLEQALSNHADEAIGKLNTQQQKLAKTLFRRLSERGAYKRDTRRPTLASEIAALGKTDIEQVIAVLDVFRDPECNFLMPVLPEQIFPDTILDISHESLIRQWARLRDWAVEEAASAEQYRFLEQTAQRWQEGKAALWDTPDLEPALAWKAQEKPTAEWAKRYGGQFDLALNFLDASEKVHDEKGAEASAKQHRELLRLRVISVSLALLFLSLVAGGYWYLDGYVWKHEEYYNTFSKRFGKPVGVGRLTKTQVRRRGVSLKFVQQDGSYNPVNYVEAVNSVGECTTEHGVGTYFTDSYAQDFSPLKECKWEYIRDANNDVIYEKAYNKQGTLVWGFAYAPRSDRQTAMGYYIGPDGFPRPQSGSAAEYVEFKYSPDGEELLIKYLDRSGQKRMPGRDGVYGLQRKFNELGLTVTAISLDRHDQKMIDKVGNAVNTITYDELGNALELAMFDTTDKPTLNIYGWHKATLRYDSYGNLIERAYFDTNNASVANLNEGIYKETSRYDVRGNPVEWSYFDTEGQPMLHKEGYHRVTGKYNERGKRIEWALFGIEGAPVADLTDKIHKVTGHYDAHGNPVEWVYFDAKNQPTLNKDGYHRVTGIYNERGQRTEWMYFDIDGASVANLTDGTHKMTGRYDTRGNQIEWVYFDEKGQATLNKDGYHRVTGVYNERGKRTEWAYFGTDGAPVLDLTNETHKMTSRYDARGNQIERAYFGKEDQPMLHKEGYHREIAKYDDRGNQIEGAYFGTDDQLIQTSELGAARMTSAYDKHGNIIESAFYGVDNRLMVNPALGYARRTYAFDKHGNIIESAFYGVDNQLIVNSEEGYARITVAYGEHGNIIEKVFYGVDNQLIVLSELGFARKTSAYDKLGNIIESAYYGEENQLMVNPEWGYARITNAYNEHGNKIEIAHYGVDNKLMVNPINGVARMTYADDDKGKLVETAYYGANNQLIMHPKDGYAKRKAAYDQRGNLIEEAYYNQDKKLLMQAFQYAKIRLDYKDKTFLTYDETGDEIDRFYFDWDRSSGVTQVMIIGVFPFSQAEKIGLQLADIILSYDGNNINSVNLFIELVQKPGEQMRKLVISRNGKILSLKVPLGKLGILIRNLSIGKIEQQR